MPLRFNLRVVGTVRSLETDGARYSIRLEGPVLDSLWRREWENGLLGIDLAMFYTATGGATTSPINQSEDEVTLTFDAHTTKLRDARNRPIRSSRWSCSLNGASLIAVFQVERDALPAPSANPNLTIDQYRCQCVVARILSPEELVDGGTVVTRFHQYS
ncbi:hypothetical protein NP233_g3491 [Leucocoprinus birnbaumii]|uniref:Uncharacterized protein n=1 Tax=Leucocoprinus birnbaumii TaxID=56174 RepID=A0AAD5VXU8_9AGAR|nr:hypothetical protein NP233_g3491 [Leucocoprinus birnbaumii]